MSQRLDPSTPIARSFSEYDRAISCLDEARFNLHQTEQLLTQSELRADSYRRQLHVVLFLCLVIIAIAVMWGVA